MREVNVTQNRSVERAIDLLDSFSINEPVLTIDEITQKTKLAKATAYRLLYTLERRGLIKYNPQTLQYSLGLKVLEYAGLLNAELQVQTVANELLIELQEKTRQTVLMAVPDGDTMVYVFTREKPEGLRFSSFLGQRRLMNFGVLGKIFMAYMNEEQRERLLELESPKLTEQTITDPDMLRNVLEQTKREGSYVEREETTPGVNGLGAPIFNHQHECIAVVGILGPTVQLTGAELERCKTLLLETTEAISERIGY